jgi:hypothetical protein
LCDFCCKATDAVWRNIAVGHRYRTPDLYKGKDFTIEEKTQERLMISPQKVSVSKSAIAATIHYLRSNQHDMDSPCEIRSSNDKATAGPLCCAAREENDGVRCINYVLPILQENAVVGINPARPNTTWLLKW